MSSENIIKYEPVSSKEATSTFADGIGTSLLPQLESDIESVRRPTVAIMSVGEMGLGIAGLMSKYSYPVITSLEERSEKTKAHAAMVGVKDVPFDDLPFVADIFLSIVPPAAAQATALRVVSAYKNANGRIRSHKSRPLVFMDLNAISPALSQTIGLTLQESGVIFVDGAIIGFPPRPINDGDDIWFRPSIPVSGPELKSAIGDPWAEHFSSLLKLHHVGADLGAASGLKMCFGAMYKGQAAVATQAYTTAQNLGVLPALRAHMLEYFPHTTPIIEGSIIGSQRKAYRWIREMEEIEETFVSMGGWEPELFRGVKDVFKLVSQQTDLQKDPKMEVQDVTRDICGGLQNGRCVSRLQRSAIRKLQ
ncbi:uncharacterized protein N7483_009919 [Penicillium malachiteum]|uniref:uncharacterized protein n=1 Tax=Penicillium malachiteum TaxID=1324776 RepID=UPI002547B683|nr:uncharacterized protein N7483_009919 [Penicillium malachiteum]KAJ5718837.1 hypothetical protein N7483_009919 [Penicillium malachiteum]